MRKLYVLLLIFSFLSFAVYSQQQSAPQMSEEQKKMMETWMKLGTPGEAHKRITALAGNYNVTTKTKMDSESPSMESTATCEKESVLGGRYVREHCSGPGTGGMPPFEGMGLLGYNNYTQQYEMFWFDNMSTMGWVLKGNADAAGKVITLNGSYEDPMTKKMKKSRWVLNILDTNKQKLEIYDTDAKGKEYLGAEINYTRK
jgi:hypothetical protein